MSDMWKRLREFLALYSNISTSKSKTPTRIRVPTKEGAAACDLSVSVLEPGVEARHELSQRANPAKDILSAIAKAYGIDPLLLAPFESQNMAGPVVLTPPKTPGNVSDDFNKRKHANGVYYYYPKMHLAGAGLYPVYLVAERGRKVHTPNHWHPGTEVIAVIGGKAKEIIHKVSEYTNLDTGELLHFCSEHKHQTINRSKNDLLRIWVFRELTSPPQTSSLFFILGQHLRSWRLQRKEALSAVAERGSFSPEKLKFFEKEGLLPFRKKNSLSDSQADRLSSAYNVGMEIMRPFMNVSNSRKVFASSHFANENKDAPRGMSYHESGHGVQYYWPRKFLKNSSILPGLLSVVPSSHTPPHRHPGSEILLVIDGEARVNFPENRTSIEPLRAGDLTHFDASWRHSVENTGEIMLKAWVLRELRAPGDFL